MNTTETTDTRTITQQSWTGEIEITKEDFVKRWADHCGDNFRLANTPEQFDKMKEFKTFMVDLAGSEFERIYSKQQEAK